MKPIHIIGVPLDLGGSRRGVDMGPSAVRIAGLGEQIAALGRTVEDRGDLATPIPETQQAVDPTKKYIHEIARVCQLLYDVASRALDQGASVVTANKMLLAAHGPALLQQAAARGVQLRFEAAVGGGVPLIHGVREGLANIPRPGRR